MKSDDHLTPQGIALFVSVGVLLVTLIVIMCVLWSWHKDKEVEFDLRYMILDSVTQKIAAEKFAYTGSFFLAGWALITLVLTGDLTEWFFGLFIGAFGVLRAASQAMSVIKDLKTMTPPLPPPPPTPGDKE